MIRSLPPISHVYLPCKPPGLVSSDQPAQTTPDTVQLTSPAPAPMAPLETVNPPESFKCFTILDESKGTIHCGQPEQLRARRSRLEDKRIAVIAVRHGESEANASGGGAILSGRGDSPLTALGKTQAQKAANHLYQNLGGDAWLASCCNDASKLPVLYASPLSRAFDTGQALVDHLQGRLQELTQDRKIQPAQSQLLASQIKLRTDADLQEIDFGRCEGQDAREVAARYPNFGKGVDFTHRFPGGEAGFDVINRMDRFFQKVEEQHPGRTVVFFGHTMTVGMSNILLGEVQHNEQGALLVDRHKILNAQPMMLTTPRPNPQEYLLARA